jgi:glycosyltransferase involved in cell wall biosynthesis
MALFFGRIESYKGLDVLVRAGLLLKNDRRSMLRIVIAGPGKLPRQTSCLIEANSDVFELHNHYISDQEVARLFQRAAVCVLPYRDASQSAIPSIAAAFGVPVVASSVGAFVEDVPYYGGLLVPPGEPKALAETMLMAVGCPVKNETCRTWDQLAASFISMYARQ